MCVHVKCVFIVRDCYNILCRRKRNEKNVHNMLTSHIRAIYPKIDKDPWIAHCKWNFPYSFWNVVKDFIIQLLLFPIKKESEILLRLENLSNIIKISIRKNNHDGLIIHATKSLWKMHKVCFTTVTITRMTRMVKLTNYRTMKVWEKTS